MSPVFVELFLGRRGILRRGEEWGSPVCDPSFDPVDPYSFPVLPPLSSKILSEEGVSAEGLV